MNIKIFNRGICGNPYMGCALLATNPSCAKSSAEMARKMKERLDVILVSQGFAVSREKAKAVIMAGNVFVNGQREDKPGAAFDTDKIKSLEVKGKTIPYVSRGGLKLEKAVQVFSLELTDKICMDIGASTGGFTDCMLQNGAKKVYAVDVGHGQLDWKLRQDERVVCMEKTNFRYLTENEIPERLDFASCDVSFISLTKILIPARNLLKAGGRMVCLIKPQFEAGREKVGKKGVVRDMGVQEEVICRVLDFADYTGFRILDVSFSPIRGPEGNIEFLAFLEKDAEKSARAQGLTEHEAERALEELQNENRGISGEDAMQDKIKQVVREAHSSLC